MTETLDLAKPENFSISYATTSNTTGTPSLDVLIPTSEAPPIISAIYSCIGRLATGLSNRGHRVKALSSADIPGFKLGELRLSSSVTQWHCVARQLGGSNAMTLFSKQAVAVAGMLFVLNGESYAVRMDCG